MVDIFRQKVDKSSGRESHKLTCASGHFLTLSENEHISIYILIRWKWLLMENQCKVKPLPPTRPEIHLEIKPSSKLQLFGLGEYNR